METAFNRRQLHRENVTLNIYFDMNIAFEYVSGKRKRHRLFAKTNKHRRDVRFVGGQCQERVQRHVLTKHSLRRIFVFAFLHTEFWVRRNVCCWQRAKAIAKLRDKED